MTGRNKSKPKKKSSKRTVKKQTTRKRPNMKRTIAEMGDTDSGRIEVRLSCAGSLRKRRATTNSKETHQFEEDTRQAMIASAPKTKNPSKTVEQVSDLSLTGLGLALDAAIGDVDDDVNDNDDNENDDKHLDSQRPLGLPKLEYESHGIVDYDYGDDNVHDDVDAKMQTKFCGEPIDLTETGDEDSESDEVSESEKETVASIRKKGVGTGRGKAARCHWLREDIVVLLDVCEPFAHNAADFGIDTRQLTPAFAELVFPQFHKRLPDFSKAQMFSKIEKMVTASFKRYTDLHQRALAVFDPFIKHKKGAIAPIDGKSQIAAIASKEKDTAQWKELKKQKQAERKGRHVPFSARVKPMSARDTALVQMSQTVQTMFAQGFGSVMPRPTRLEELQKFLYSLPQSSTSVPMKINKIGQALVQGKELLVDTFFGLKASSKTDDERLDALYNLAILVLGEETVPTHVKQEEVDVDSLQPDLD